MKKVEDCKPFVASNILFVCWFVCLSVSVMISRIMIYFRLKSKNNNVLPY